MGERNKHGMSRKPEFRKTYNRWKEMHQRCANPKRPGYHNYGGRGIAVCDRWQRFDYFVADMGLAPDRMWLERLDNDGDYSPDNCIWATPAQQANNTRRVKMLEHDGHRMSMHDWAKRLGIAFPTLRGRLKKWPVARALSTPSLARSQS